MLINEIKKSKMKKIIISDVRFKHEIEELKKEFKDVRLIKIIRN